MLFIFKSLKKFILKSQLKRFLKIVYPDIYSCNPDEFLGWATLDNNDIDDLRKSIASIDTKTLGKHLQYLVDSKNIKKDSEVYFKADISKEYWNKLLNDKYDKPSKNKLIRIAFALNLNCSEVHDLLEVAGYSFKPNHQDCAIKWFFEKNIYDLIEIDDLLTSLGLVGIFNDKDLA